jgi:muramoyltetrapeptide carboxypeptidase
MHTRRHFPISTGATIGVAAPAGPFDEALFREGVDRLAEMGFKVHVDPRIGAKTGFLAGGDAQRAEVLHDLFERNDISAIVCARGGYGSLRLLSLLNVDRIRNHPKPFVGFSDITVLLNFLAERCGTPTIHGPVATSLAGADADTLTGFQKALAGARVALTVSPLEAICPGSASGRLLGGNLTTLNHLLATGYMPDFRRSILLLEDVNEAPYRLDRMLCQMRLAGCFDGVAGVVLGRFHNCGQPGEARDVFVEHFEAFAVPVLGGFPIGHGGTNMAVPFGVPATVDADAGTLCVNA